MPDDDASRRGPRRVAIAAAIYSLVTFCCFALAPREHLIGHTPYNHYALQADAWLHGRLDLGGPPPSYTGNNDFALHEGRWFVSFPPVPAALMVPFVAAAGSAERARDGLVFLWLAGLAPALLFLALERLREAGRSRRREIEHAALAVLFALGTVYWFSAVQGTVWFAGHVLTAALVCGYLWCSVEARHPLAAGLCLALAIGTRPSVAGAGVVLLYEIGRRHRGRDALRALGLGALPCLLVGGLLAWHNLARFGDPAEFGHRLLAVRWRGRIDKWGLFSTHYLGRNLAVLLAGLPFYTPDRGIQINGHGLALWLTSPIYLWALWPKRTGAYFWAVAAAAAAVALPSLLYQNTGWVQFGYRFSNDYAPLLFVMLALGARRLSPPFWLLATCAIFVNGFGALTFGKARYRHLYFIDPTQRVLHAPD